MLLNASLWRCTNPAAPQRHHLKALLYLRPSSKTLVQSTFNQARGLTAKIKRQTPKKAIPYASKITAYESAAGKLAKNPVPTLIYQSESNVPYILGCYLISGIIFGCAVINNATREASITADVPPWVRLGVVAGQFFMIGFGCWWFLKPQNLVKSIKSIPLKQPGARSVLLQIERTKSIPFLRRPIFIVSSRDVTISTPLFLGSDKQVQAEIRELQRQEMRYLYLNVELSPLTYPFRFLGYWTILISKGVLKAFTNRGLISFHVRGNNFPWKMETEAAWALEEGRALDEVVRIKDV